MSSARCHELAQSVRHAEVALHAHILAEPPPPPPPAPPKNPISKYGNNYNIHIMIFILSRKIIEIVNQLIRDSRCDCHTKRSNNCLGFRYFSYKIKHGIKFRHPTRKIESSG